MKTLFVIFTMNRNVLNPGAQIFVPMEINGGDYQTQTQFVGGESNIIPDILKPHLKIKIKSLSLH